MGERSTRIGGGESRFPSTCWTAIRDAADPASTGYRESLERLAAAYWRPVYVHFRRRWAKSNEDAKDLTQEFFAALQEKGFLAKIEPGLGRFRAYVKTALDNFARLDHRGRGRLKRGGGRKVIPLDDLREFEPSTSVPPEQAFDREWARSVLDGALHEMEGIYRAAGMEKAYRMFLLKHIEAPDDEDLSYEALAKRFGLKATDVTNRLHRARRKLQTLIFRRVRETVGSDEEADAEIAELFAARRGRSQV